MYKVLLVDDEKIARMGLRATFDWEGNGFHVVGEAANGQKAMRWVENREVDILITDIAMPVMNGLELTRITKEFCPWAQVLLLSCHSDFEYVREGIRLGASDYMLKPTLNEDALKSLLICMRGRIDLEKRNLQILNEYREKEASQFKKPAEKNSKSVPPIPPEETLHERIVTQATSYIKLHYHKGISLQEVASHVSVSRNYFCEMFKRVTGQNFTHYLIELRINRAAELLTTSSLKVYEVAEQVGFNDVKHFSKQFKKCTGMSPAEYQGLYLKTK
ncbi:response regulator [Paenibacillus sp. Marseille-Q4541]|uniref:response regulator transcription factor n=1 Tax=Paenibacillus sp. Marseille-Q4541 TaxID=2831522 RepID=UPI001BA617B7|nr:response regulator [Paenibacillus sp. Marseille-Q4541]